MILNDYLDNYVAKHPEEKVRWTLASESARKGSRHSDVERELGDELANYALSIASNYN